MRTLILLFIALFVSPLFAHGTIIITNVEHGDGYIDVKIYDSKDNFLKEDLARETIRKKATKGKTVVPLSKVHEGKIAIVVYHDEDNNGKLKQDYFGDLKKVMLLVIIINQKVLLNFPKHQLN